MRRLMMCLVLMGSMAPTVYAQNRTAPPKPAEKEDSDPFIISGRCGVFIKWVGQTIGVTSETMLSGAEVGKSDVRWAFPEFWNGPYYSDDAKTLIEQSMLAGRWGAFHIDGEHNSAFSAEFFPPGRIVRMRWEYDCWH